MRREQAGETLTITDDARVWEMQYSTPVKQGVGSRPLIQNSFYMLYKSDEMVAGVQIRGHTMFLIYL